MNVRPVDAGELDMFARVFEAAWAFASSDEQRRTIAEVLGGERPLGAYLPDGAMVGTAMSFGMELTVPGGTLLPMAGVSYVSVHPLHRRQGVMRALMHHQLGDLHERGVPLAGLGASEAGIYGRYGYGPATWDSSWRLARGAITTTASDEHRCSLELVEAEVAREVFPVVHDAARRRQIGDVRTYPGRWNDLAGSGAQPGTQFLLCREDGRPSGYAAYRLQREERYSSHATVIVDHLVSSTDAAYRRLWTHLADLDLTDCVIAHGRPEHEKLQWMLRDRRHLVVTDVHDHLWLRLVNVAEALSGRRYRAEGRLVLHVSDTACPWNAGSWLLTGGPDEAECHRADAASDADLTLDASALASIYLGGASVADLAGAGRIAGDASAIRAADRMFGSDSKPWCSTEF